MTVRDSMDNGKDPDAKRDESYRKRRNGRGPVVTGWKLVVAVAIVGMVYGATLWITKSFEAALLVAIVLLSALGLAATLPPFRDSGE